MKNYFLKYSLCLAAVLLVASGIAQVPAGARHMVVVRHLLNTVKQAQTTRQFLPGDSLRAVMVVNLQDTTGIVKLHVKFGSTAGSANFLNKAFVYDVSGSFADKTAYRRKGKTVYLTLGEPFMGLNQFYAEVVLEHTGGQFSAPKTYTEQ